MFVVKCMLLIMYHISPNSVPTQGILTLGVKTDGAVRDAAILVTRMDVPKSPTCLVTVLALERLPEIVLGRLGAVRIAVAILGKLSFALEHRALRSAKLSSLLGTWARQMRTVVAFGRLCSGSLVPGLFVPCCGSCSSSFPRVWRASQALRVCSCSFTVGGLRLNN